MAGKLVHLELPARDTGRARAFYAGLFGWTFQDWQSGGGAMEYHMFQGEPGGAIYPSEHVGPLVYFDTGDIDATLAKVRELGGTSEEKQAIPGVGWSARCADSEGNTICFFQSDESIPTQAG